jgi:hypothetical protein
MMLFWLRSKKPAPPPFGSCFVLVSLFAFRHFSMCASYLVSCLSDDASLCSGTKKPWHIKNRKKRTLAAFLRSRCVKCMPPF